MISNKKKLALIELPETKGVLFDALVTFVGEARGEVVDEKHMLEMTDAILYSLKVQYQPVVQKVSKQIDLEESIAEIKSHPDYEKQKKSCKLGKQKLDSNDFLPKEEQDGQDNH